MKTKTNIPKRQGFEVPASYFKDFDNRLQDEIALRTILDASSKSVFEVPDGYFEEISNTIENRIKESTVTSKPKVIQLKKVIPLLMAVAAAVLLIINIIPTNNQSPSVSNLDLQTVASYLEYSDLETLEFDIEALGTFDDSDFLLSDLTTDDEMLIDYLNDETDLYDLYID